MQTYPPTKVALAAILTLCSAAPCSTRSEEYSYRVPTKHGDGWEVAHLKEVGIEQQGIEALTQRLLTERRFANVLGLVIVKDGALVHEVYSPHCQRNTLHPLASITKAVTSTLVGIAIDREFIESAETPALELLPSVEEAVRDPRFGEVTLEHLMTMSSGLDWFEHGSSYNDQENCEHLMVEEDDWMRFVVGRSVVHEPGTHPLYNTGGIHLLSAVIKDATGLHANEFAEEHLLHPLGIRGYQWNRDPMGYPCTGGTDGGLGLRTRDLAKLGWLFLKDGRWKGKQIVSRDWVARATRKHVRIPSLGADYGYGWFPGFRKVAGRRLDYVASFGYGGQTLYVVRELDLVIAVSCALTESNNDVHLLVNGIFEALRP